MRIVCPACAAAYDVPDGRLLPGRTVRCARCETDWVPTPERPPVADPVAPEPAPPEPEPEPIAEPSAAIAAEPAPEVPAPVVSAEDRFTTSGGRRYVGALRVAWALSGVVLLAAAWFAYSARDSVMQAWPPSVRAYAAIGLAPKH